MEVLPLFKSHYSIGRSILTLDKPDEIGHFNPTSIFSIIQKHQLNQCCLVEDSISGFLEANERNKEVGCKIVYGLRLNVISDISNKNADSLKTLHKVIVFMRNKEAYKDLIRISSFACCEGFYYEPNIDFKMLSKLWTKNLRMAIPFYDSFLFNNTLVGGNCVPEFSFTTPVFFVEESGLPFDRYIKEKVTSYANSIGAPMQRARSIYYYDPADFKAYLTFRCIHNRTSLEKPEMEHMSMPTFSFKNWEKQNGRTST